MLPLGLHRETFLEEVTSELKLTIPWRDQGKEWEGTFQLVGVVCAKNHPGSRMVAGMQGEGEQGGLR